MTVSGMRNSAHEQAAVAKRFAPFACTDAALHVARGTTATARPHYLLRTTIAFRHLPVTIYFRFTIACGISLYFLV